MTKLGTRIRELTQRAQRARWLADGLRENGDHDLADRYIRNEWRLRAKIAAAKRKAYVIHQRSKKAG